MLRQVREVMVVVAALSMLTACTKDKETPAAAKPAAAEAKAEVKAAPPEAAPAAPYELSVLTKEPTAAGALVATATITAKDGFHVNPEYPVAFKPEAEGTVKFESERLALGEGKRTPCAAPHEADMCSAAFDLPFTATAGEQKLVGVLAFSVCSADKCLIEKAPVRIALNVK